MTKVTSKIITLVTDDLGDLLDAVCLGKILKFRHCNDRNTTALLLNVKLK